MIKIYGLTYRIMYYIFCTMFSTKKNNVFVVLSYTWTCSWRVGGGSAGTSALLGARRSLTCSSRYPILWVSLRLSDRRVRSAAKDSPFRRTTICAASGATANSLAKSLLPAPTTSFPFTSKILQTMLTDKCEFHERDYA